MVSPRRPLHAHQVKVSLREADARAIERYARASGVGAGTFVRGLALKHLVVLRRVAASASPRVADDARPRLASHVSVWLADDEYALLRNAAMTIGSTVSGYLGRYVVEPWLQTRRTRQLEAETPLKKAN